MPSLQKNVQLCSRKKCFAAVCQSKYFDGGKYEEKVHQVGCECEVNDSWLTK